MPYWDLTTNAWTTVNTGTTVTTGTTNTARGTYTTYDMPGLHEAIRLVKGDLKRWPDTEFVDEVNVKQEVVSKAFDELLGG